MIIDLVSGHVSQWSKTKFDWLKGFPGANSVWNIKDH